VDKIKLFPIKKNGNSLKKNQRSLKKKADKSRKKALFPFYEKNIVFLRQKL
jgi:hypothetical protein